MFRIIVALLILLAAAVGIKNLMIALLLVGAVLAFACAFSVWRDNKRYSESEYFRLTRNPRGKMMRDRGLRGEYKIYDVLKELEGRKRFLFNLYLPKDDGGTTEVDVIMLHESGIYVFESKNYSGWIFGSEYQKSWTQTLPRRRGSAHREYFMNPIAQNKVHLKWLGKALADDSLTIHSYIVFGSDCKLKNITLKDGDHHVLKVDDLLDEVRINAHDTGNVMSEERIEAVYSRLVGYCAVDESVKKAHIEEVSRKKNATLKVDTDAEKASFDESSAIAETPEKAIQPDESAEKPESGESAEKTAPEPECTPNLDVPNLDMPDPSTPDAKICPVCGSKLVLRHATRGENTGRAFWGCSAFPKCRYIEAIPENVNKK